LVRHQQLSQSLTNVTSLCTEVGNERVSHIQAIESARGKRIYDSHTEYQTFVLDKQGKQAHNDYIQSIKHRLFGDRYLQTNRPNDTVKGLSG
jgi:ferric iron reductase protein FhuF